MLNVPADIRSTLHSNHGGGLGPSVVVGARVGGE